MAYVAQAGVASNTSVVSLLNVTLSRTVQAGHLLLAFISIDATSNSTAGGVTSIGKRIGETNDWVKLADLRYPASGVPRFQIWGIITTTGWPSATTYQIQWSNSGDNPIAIFEEFDGAHGLTLRDSVTLMLDTSSDSVSISANDGDLLIGAAAGEGSGGSASWALTSFPSNWSTEDFRDSGGTSTLDAYVGMQYKFANSTTTYSYGHDPPSRADLILLALQPAIVNISFSRTFKWNVFAAISLSRIFKWNVIQNISLNRILQWNVAKNISTSRIFKWNVRTGISLARTFKWNVIGGVLISRVLKWNVRAIFSINRVLKWNVRVPISTSRILKWNVRVSASTSRIFKWNVKQTISTNRILQWNVYTVLSVLRTLKWNVYGFLSVDRTFMWRVFAPWVKVPNGNPIWDQINPQDDIWNPVNENGASWTPDSVNSTPWT